MMRLTEDQRDWQFWINDQYADFQPSRESLQRLLADRVAVRQAAQEAARALTVLAGHFEIPPGLTESQEHEWATAYHQAHLVLTKLKVLGVEP